MDQALNLTREQLVIWAAGFFDGEGCISVAQHKKRGYCALNMTVFQTIKEPLEVLAHLFGGSIRPRRASGTSRSGWVWSLCGADTISACNEMLPFLMVKTAQARLAIVFQTRKVPRGGKYADPVLAKTLDMADYKEMRNLKGGAA